ncbi:hypothetical protein NMG60_11006909 [Bertholletia excelsa]
MSILPSKDLGSASSSSRQAPYLNPNSNHGLFFSHPDQQEKPTPNPQPQVSQSPSISPSYATRPLRSLQISNSTQLSDKITGVVAPTAENSGGSSKKVNESGKTNRKKFASPQNNGRDSRSNSISNGSLCSVQHRDKLPETVISTPSQSTSGSANCQASSTPSAGRKPQVVNGNHLLNFHYDHISRPQPRAPPPRRHHKRRPYNKDLFLQANYKFVVLESGNHAPDLLNPDKMLRWEDIICVKFSTAFAVQCPICLDDPLCPQITSCGHIFCFPCILRYFSIGEDDHKGECWKKCPLCFMMVSSKDLYTIYIENVKQHRVGDTAEFMLLTRQKDSVTLSLKNKQGPGNNVEVPDAFSKFTFTSDVDLSVRKAISDLDSWLAKADAGLVDDMEKLPYVCAALEQLEQRRKYWGEQQIGQGSMPSKWKNIYLGSKGSAQTADHANASNESSKFVLGPISTGGNVKSEWMGISTPDQLNGEICLDPNVVDELLEDQDSALSSSYGDSKIIRSNTVDFRDAKEKDSYNFYQAVDGQHVILHPLNMKCLLRHYGSYDRLPHRISGKILQLETITQSEAMRRRYRFLSHISLTTAFQLCEIDLCQLLPPDAVSPFMDEIKKREKQRKHLAKKEWEDKIKAEAALMQCIPKSLSFAQCSSDMPPIFSMDDFEALGSSAVSSLSPPTVGERKLFSNVARLGFAAGHDSPALKIDDVQSLSNREIISDSTGLRNAGTVSFANVTSRAKTSEGEGLENGPSKLSEMAKKGKKQSKVLLSTAGGRRY